MGILGIRIQTKNGLPIYTETWSEKLEGFESADQMLQAGFMTAILSFAKNLKNKVGFIRFLPEQDEDSEHLHQSYGIDAMISLRKEIIFILFLEPYIFKKHIELKIDWIYEMIVKNYENQIEKGERIEFTNQEEKLIENILFDSLGRKFINKRRKKIEKKINKLLIKKFSHENIRGIAICSFDNSILFSYLIDEKELQIYLNNMGLITKIKEWDTQYKPIWLTNKSPILVSVVNSAMKVPIIPDIDKSKLRIPYFYYLISDQDASLGPLTEKLLFTLNHFFLEDNE